MKQLLLAGVAAAGLAFAAGGAQAAVFGTTPASNDIIGVREGWFGANLYLVGGPTTATVTFVGKEAGFTNTFNINGGAIEFDTSVTAAGTSLLNVPLANGLLDFVLATLGGSGVLPGSVTNGANVLPGGTPPAKNFFVSLGSGAGFLGDNDMNGSTPGSGTAAIIAFDDTGAGQDDNHDDLVVRIVLNGGTFTVPEPASLALLGMGLLGLGFAARRRRG